jgi:antitoxin component of RelBE/YafQ-DinJ toxin-antitoxin module
MAQRARVNVKLSQEVYDSLKRWSKELGITMSQLGGMAVYSGLRNITRSIDPMRALTDDELRRLIATVDSINAGDVDVDVKSSE